MKLKDPRLWLVVFSLALVGALVALSWERTSPGPLSAVHARLPELAGKQGCDACHGGLLESMEGACLDCHADIGAQIAAKRGLHGALQTPLSCARCHQEHLGDDAALSGPATFELAGLGPREGFTHGHVAFTLVGRHGELGCAACHASADAQPLPAGQKRFLGLDQRCTSCHADPHAGRFARGCETCHGQERPFGELASFVHGEAFPLTGAHARPACLDCHPKDGPHAVEALAGSAPPPPARLCLDCHASPHTAGFVGAVSATTSLQPGATCARCHPAQDGGFRAGAELPRELHAASGFALEPPHERVDCSACHAPSRVAQGGGFSERFPGRGSHDCAACHTDPHGGQFQRGALAAQVEREGCLACHAPHGFAPPSFDTAAHAATAFALEGRHREVACGACHLQAEPGAARTFVGTPRACAACHVDPHGDAWERSARAADCGTCHVPSAFAHVERERFDHGAWTGFPLQGAHASAECAACHPKLRDAGPGGRTTARASEVFRGAPWDCASCHADVHRGAFGGEDCAGCHVPVRFTHIEPPFDHAGRTGFALEGAHARVACAACHGGAVLEAGRQRALGFVRERVQGPLQSCSTCHADPHGGRFDREGQPALVAGRAGCARCHTTESFRAIDPAGFDHGLWTGYALEGAHARAACASCHAPDKGGKLGPSRGSGCAACHADPHAGQFARGGTPGDCGRCHSPAAESFTPERFDHDRDARFALDATHRKLDCSACHLPWPLASGEQVVRYRPLGTACADCHRSPPRSTGGGG